MKTKIKYTFGLMAASLLFVPMIFTGDVEAVAPAYDTCGYIWGSTADQDNVGMWESYEAGYNVCINETGTVVDVDSYLWSDNVGRIKFNDHGVAPINVNMTTGEWSGYAYAPMNVSNWDSTFGTYFYSDPADPVYTDLWTGEITGSLCSDAVGCIDLAGMYQALPPVTIEADISLIGTDVVADGSDVYTVQVVVTFPMESTVNDSFLNTFDFEGNSSISDSGQLDLRQDSGLNDGLNRDAAFTRVSQVDGDGGQATYELEIASYAPTADEVCSNATFEEFEFCIGGTNAYSLGILSLEGNLSREFEWVVPGYFIDGTVDGVETVAMNEDLSFAPIYEVDYFGLLDDELGTRITDDSNLPPLEEGAIYNFTGEVIQNGVTTPGVRSLDFEYLIDDADFTFGQAGCGVSNTSISGFGVESFEGHPAIRGIELCDLGENELPDGTPAEVRGSFTLQYDGLTVQYNAQAFGFVDRTKPFPDTRVWVDGTVSGTASGDDITVVGSVTRFELRQSIFQEVMILTRSITADPGGGDVDGFFTPAGEALVNNSVYYFTGDVDIDGGIAYNGDPLTILVVGGDVFLDGDITGTGEIGIVVLEDSNGDGGDLHIDSDVTDIKANIFLDGSFLRADRLENPLGETDLKSQLYISGSLVSQNTIEGYENGCLLGSGETGACEQAMLEDLEYASYYQVCYPYFEGTFTIDTSTTESCPGYTASSEYTGSKIEYPVIIQYDPPSSDLPIFNLASSS